MLPLPRLFALLLLSASLLTAAHAQNSTNTTAVNISFTLVTAAAPFPATFTAGSAYLTTVDVVVPRNGTNSTYPSESWLLLGGSAESASEGAYNDVWISWSQNAWALWNGVEAVRGSTVAGVFNASYSPVAGAASCRDNAGHYFVVAGEHTSATAANDTNYAVPSYASYDTAQHFQPAHYNRTTSSPLPRSFATCMATTSGDVVVVGGNSSGVHSSGWSDVWLFSVDWSQDGVQANDWQLLANASTGEPRYGHASTVAFGQGADCIDVLYVTGGKGSRLSVSSVTYYNDVLYSVDGGRSWTPRNSTSALWSPRAFHSLTHVAASGLLIVAGGQNATAAFNDVWLSWNGGVDWQLATAAAGFPPRSGHALLVDAGGRPVVLGGSDYFSNASRRAAYNDVWTLPGVDLRNLTATAALLRHNLSAPYCAALPGIDCSNNCPAGEDFSTKILIAAVVLGVLFFSVVGFLLWSRRSGPHKRLAREAEYEEEVYEEEEDDEGEDDNAYTQAPR